MSSEKVEKYSQLAAGVLCNFQPTFGKPQIHGPMSPKEPKVFKSEFVFSEEKIEPYYVEPYYYKQFNQKKVSLTKGFRVAIINRIKNFLFVIIKKTYPISREWKMDIRFPKKRDVKIKIFMNAGIFKMELSRERILDLYFKQAIEKEIIKKFEKEVYFGV